MCVGVFSLGACSEKSDREDEPDIVPEQPGGGNHVWPGDNDDPNDQVADATACKEKLSENAKVFLDKFNPNDQTELNDLCSYFMKTYAGLDLPENFYMDDQRYYMPDAFFRALLAFSRGDVTGLSRSVTTFVYNVDFSLFKGVYEPGYSEWKKKEESDNVVFRFNDRHGIKTELVISALTNAGTTDVNVEVEEWDEVDRYEVKLPKSIDVKLRKVGSYDGYLFAQLNNDIDVVGHKFKILETISCGDYSATVEMQGSDATVTSSESLRKYNKPLVELRSSFSGSHLCDKEYILEADEDEIYEMVKSGDATAVIDGETILKGKCSFSRLLMNTLAEDYYDDWDYQNKIEAQVACQQNCSIINRNLSCELSFTSNSGTAKALVAPSLYESEYYWCYEYDYQLEFADGSRISMNDYFGRGFSSIVRQGESLWNAYCRMWSIF